MRRAVCAPTRARTSSAPVRVLPKPRPASSSQMRQSPGGGNCSGLARYCHSYFSLRALSRGSDQMRLFLSGSGSEASELARKEFTRIFPLILRRRWFLASRRRREHAEVSADRDERGLSVIKLEARMPGVGA